MHEEFWMAKKKAHGQRKLFSDKLHWDLLRASALRPLRRKEKRNSIFDK